jgi:hypothetical protein
MNVFLACPMDMDTEEADKIRGDLEGVLSEIEHLNVVTSKSDFTENFSRSGSWSSWIDRVIRGRNYQTQKELFDAYITTQVGVGKATADIVRGAFELRKPVMMFRDGMLHRASGVATVDDDNWRSGWCLTFPK